MATTFRGTAAALFIAAVIVAGATGLAHGEYVFLKNGRVINCRIINETAGAVTVQTPDGKIAVYPRGAVLRLLYTQLYMGKVYINKVDGKVLEAYIVDEDQDNYTLRKDLNKPEEIVIKRTDVLFMVRKNPSALEAKISKKHADLSWKPPYNPVKYYKVYVKTKKGEYKAVGETSFTSFRLKGLNCKSEYMAMVTAVDRENYESLPSNELQIVTDKGKPSPPSRIRIAKITSDKNDVYTARLAWTMAEDPCGGIIENYCVYIKVAEDLKTKIGAKDAAAQARGKIPAGYRLAGKTSGDTFNITGLRDNTTYSILMTSVDNAKEESEPGSELTFDTGRHRPRYPYPITIVTELSKTGKERTALLSWKEVKDPFSRIKAYHVFRKTPGGFERIGSTEKTLYEIKNLPAREKQIFMVRTMDVRGIMSDESFPVSTGLLHYAELAATAGLVIPLGDYGKLYRPGYNVSLSLSVKNLFFNGISLGVESGYSYLKGKTKSSRFSRMIPFTALIGWSWQPFRWLTIGPRVSVGGSYNTTDRTVFIRGTLESILFQRYKEASQVELMFGAGANVTFLIKKYVMLRVEAEFCGIVEKKKLLDFIRINGGVGYSF